MPEHPYTKLLEELDGAHFVRFDQASGLIHTWHGETRVQVFNKEGACADFYSIPAGANIDDVERAVAEYIEES